MEHWQLQPILYPAIPDSLSSQASQTAAVRCAEPDGTHLYVGTSDGRVAVYSSDPHDAPAQSTSSSSSDNSYHLLQTHTVSPSGKPVERILILKAVDLIAVQCEAALHFLTLPLLGPLPTSPRPFPRLKGVSMAVLDDHQGMCLDGCDNEGRVSIAVLRRKNVVLAKIGREGWYQEAEYPLPAPATLARRWGPTLVLCDTSSYSMIDLRSGKHIALNLPISQSTDTPSAQVRPSIVCLPLKQPSSNSSTKRRRREEIELEAIGGVEFLVTSHAEDQTLGVFLNAAGDPSPKLLEWSSHPRSLALSYPHLHCLLRNDTIETFNISEGDLPRTQVQQLPSLLEPRFLSSGSTIFHLAPEDAHLSGSAEPVIEWRWYDASATTSSDQDSEDAPIPPTHLLSPPITTSILLGARNGIQAITERPHFSLHTALRCFRESDFLRLEEGLDELSNSSHGEDGTARIVIKFLHQQIFLQHLQACAFKKAERHFARGEIDVRVALRIFSDLGDEGRSSSNGGNLNGRLIVCRDLAQWLRTFAGLSEVVAHNLELNYAPYLSIRDSPSDSIVSLSSALMQIAREVGICILQQWWDSLDGASTGARASAVRPSVFRTLFRLLIAAGPDRATELDRLVLSCPSTDLDLDSIRAPLIESGRYWTTVQILRGTGAESEEEILRIWTALHDETLQDPSFANSPNSTIANFIAYLETVQDARLVRQFAVWLAGKDPEAGVRLLTRKGRKGTTGPSHSLPAAGASIEEHRETIRSLASVDKRASEAYLEHLALGRKVQAADLHVELLNHLVEVLKDAVLDDDVSDAVQRLEHTLVTEPSEKDASATSLKPTPFLSRVAALCPPAAPVQAPGTALGEDSDNVGDSPTSAVTPTPSVRDYALARLKLVILLQGSSLLNDQQAKFELDKSEGLGFEKAVLLGKMGKRVETLHMLALTLREPSSAEMYCASNGRTVLPVAHAEHLATERGLKPYAALISKLELKPESEAEDDLGRRELSTQLLKLYMEDGKDDPAALAELLNRTPAALLPCLSVLPSIPDEWPVSTMSPFLSRALRAQYHERSTGQVLKALALAQNLEGAEKAWKTMRGMGGVIQDEDEDGDNDERSSVDTVLSGRSDELNDGEKTGGHWKEVGLSEQALERPRVHDVKLDDAE